jgi:hypothetical protein
MVATRRWGASRLSALSSTTLRQRSVSTSSARRTRTSARHGTTPGGNLATVEHDEHRANRWCAGLAAALAGGGDGPLADRLHIAGGHTEAVPPEGFAQQRPGGAPLGRGDVDAAQPLG